jgi:hypothetical protein
MKKSDDLYVNLFSKVEKLLGETPDNKELAAIVSWMGYRKFPSFKDEEWAIYLSKENYGFCLKFDDAELVKHACAKGKPPRTPILTGGFFYAKGVEDYHQFSGLLPHGMEWSDTPASVEKKFKGKAKPFKNKTTKVLEAHFLVFGRVRITVSYKQDLSSVSDFYLRLD